MNREAVELIEDHREINHPSSAIAMAEELQQMVKATARVHT